MDDGYSAGANADDQQALDLAAQVAAAETAFQQADEILAFAQSDLDSVKKQIGGNAPTVMQKHQLRLAQDSYYDACTEYRTREQELEQWSADLEEYRIRSQDDPNDTDDFEAPVNVYTLIFPQTLPKGAYDPEELRDPVAENSVPCGARRWKFQTDLEPADEAKAYTKIVNVLWSQDYDIADCTITFPARTGQTRYVQIHFKNPADYGRSKNLVLKWNSTEIVLAYSAAPMSRRKTVLTVNSVLGTGNDQHLLQQLFSDLGQFMEINTMWRRDQQVTVSGEQLLVPGSSIVAVATYKLNAETRKFWRPHQVPGWVKVATGNFQLHFLDRRPSCTFCREHILLPAYHRTEECIKRRCPACTGRGHAEVACPSRTNKRARDDPSAAAPTFNL